jgi:hypothetical protein
MQPAITSLVEFGLATAGASTLTLVEEIEVLLNNMSTGTKITPAPSTSGSVKRIIAALALSAIGIAGSSHLLLSHAIGEVSFVALALSSVILGVVIFWSDRVSSFSFKNLSVDLAKIEEARIEVESKREEIEELAYLTVRLVTLTQNGVLTMGRTSEIQNEIFDVSKKILEAAGIPKSDEVFQQILASDDKDSKND